MVYTIPGRVVMIEFYFKNIECVQQDGASPHYSRNVLDKEMQLSGLLDHLI